ncbi:DMT family transporter [Propylenella binzhouense]|uniref:DMT family transporter n=1 Tax=Propylenella binzhouense TaxID=2555902 RepID=A0A964T867_9HYPH|nr:DMT family transporter [Propylenella binzhouense]MYZ50244.1 DMT family transporter [Propylenella binzhouense]
MPSPQSPARSSNAARDYTLFGATVLLWGTTWIALKLQLGTVAPQVSLVWRFLLAAPIMAVVARSFGAPLLFPLRTHLRFAGIGVLMFSTNFVLFYNAGAFVVSGLLSVIFSLAAVINIVLAVTVLREPLRPRVAFGALIGVAGAACLFGHEIAGTALGWKPATGLLLGVCGTFSFCLGNMLAARNQRDGIPVLSGAAWGMAYGALANAAVALVAGSRFAIDPHPAYVLSLLWLAIPGSVVTFWAYLVLLGRIGPDRAAYTAVLAPVLALVVSTLFEDYHWSPIAFLGIGLVVAGNVLVLARRQRRA